MIFFKKRRTKLPKAKSTKTLNLSYSQKRRQHQYQTWYKNKFGKKVYLRRKR